jgi:hypothetical protein
MTTGLALFLWVWAIANIFAMVGNSGWVSKFEYGRKFTYGDLFNAIGFTILFPGASALFGLAILLGMLIGLGFTVVDSIRKPVVRNEKIRSFLDRPIFGGSGD